MQDKFSDYIETHFLESDKPFEVRTKNITTINNRDARELNRIADKIVSQFNDRDHDALQSSSNPKDMEKKLIDKVTKAKKRLTPAEQNKFPTNSLTATVGNMYNTSKARQRNSNNASGTS